MSLHSLLVFTLSDFTGDCIFTARRILVADFCCMDPLLLEDEFDRILREDPLPDDLLRAADALEVVALGSSWCA